MRLLMLVILAALISGCASRMPVFTLSPYPQSSGCSRPECQRLDAIEAESYELARNGKLTWVKLVDDFYAERNKLFPNTQENNSTREYISYQRVLAEQLDNKKISESEWVYLLEKKIGELNARNQMLQNSQPRQASAPNVGGTPAPNVGGTPVYRADECIGPVINGKCHGSIIPKSAVPQRCYGTMLNGQCIGPQF